MFQFLKAKYNKYFGKFIAALSALTLSITSVLFVNVIAATPYGEGNFTETFETTSDANAKDYYEAAGNAIRPGGSIPDYGQYARYVNGAGVGHQSDSAMRLQYTANDSNATTANQYFAIFSIGDRKYNYGAGSSGTWRPQFGKYYRISFWYKVENLTTNANIVIHMEKGNKSLNLATDALGKYDNTSSTTTQSRTSIIAASLKANDSTNGTWVKSNAVVFQGNGIDRSGGLYIYLDTENDSNRAGSSVLIDDVHIENINLSTLTFDTNGGSEVPPTAGVVGEDIAVTPPTKKGMVFDGWYIDKDCSQPITKYPSANATVYAGWIPNDAYVQSFENSGGSPLLEWGFETSDILNGYYKKSANGNNVYNSSQGAFAEYIPNYGEGAHGGTGVMKLYYTNNYANGQPAAFSLSRNDSSSTWKATAGTTYRLKFWYKVEKLTSDAVLKVYNCSANLTHARIRYGDNNSEATGFPIYVGEAATLTATATAGEWKQAEVVFTAVDYTNGAGIYISLEMKNDNDRVNSVVLIDDVVLEDYKSPFTYYGKTNVSSESSRTGSKSVKITAGIEENSQLTSRVVYTDSKEHKKFNINEIYTATAWVYAPVSFKAKFRIVNDYNLNNMAEWKSGKSQMEKVLTLPANTWVRVQVYFPLRAIAGESQAYLSFGITASESSGTYVVYMDDVSIGTYTPNLNMVQNYEKFEARTYSERTNMIDGTIHGNGSGITVTTEKNHTEGGGKSLKMTMNRDAENNLSQIARTVLFIDQTDLFVKNGESYTVSFWAYSPETVEVYFGLGTSLQVNPSASNAASTRKDLEDNATTKVAMEANKWTFVTVTVPKVQGAGGAVNPFMTLAAWFDGASDSNVKVVYIDDVMVSQYNEYIPDPKVQSFETYSVGENVGLNTGKNTVIVSDAYKRSGNKSVEIVSSTSAGGTRPQFMVKDGNNQQVMVTAGMNYTVTFWVYLPVNANHKNLRFWLTATDDEVPFTSGAQKDAVKIYEVGDPDIILEPGQWQQMRADIQNCKRSGKLRLGITIGVEAQVVFYLDDISVVERYPSIPGVESFEGYNPNDNVGLITGSNTITVTDEVSHDGLHSAKVVSSTNAGGPRPQMIVTNGAGEKITVEAGKNYTFTFWVYIGEANKKIRFWLTATEDEVPFSSGAEKDAVKIYETSSDIALNPGEWRQIRADIVDCKYSGKLRLGITSSETALCTFYIDDLILGDYVPYDKNVQNFESYKEGTNIGLNTGSNEVVISKEFNHTTYGRQSAKIVSTLNGVNRPQFVLTDGDNNNISVVAGKSYKVSFWVYMPQGASNTELIYWLAATNDGNAFTSEDQKNAAKIYESDANGVNVTPGQWKQVTVEIIKSAHSGLLRLGIAAKSSGSATFYVDDITVENLLAWEFDPNSKVQNFEKFEIGEKGFIMLNSGEVSDKYNHTQNGTKSLELRTKSWAGIDRNQVLLVDPSTGKPYELTKGEKYDVSFWVYIPIEEANFMSLNFWLMCTDQIGSISNKTGAEYDIGGNNNNIIVYADEWYQVRVEITAKNGKYLILGISDNTSDKSGTTYYVDDIVVQAPQYVEVRFDTNGSTDEYDPIRILAGLKLPPLTSKTTQATDPYREGYEFTGWYTDKECTKPFNVLEDPVTESMTLYAGWRPWRNEPTETSKPTQKPEQEPEQEKKPRYKTVYEYEKEYIGNDEKPLLEAGDRPVIGNADPVVREPDKDTESPEPENGLPVWAIVLIVIIVVAICAGGTVTVLLLRRRKSLGGNSQ